MMCLTSCLFFCLPEEFCDVLTWTPVHSKNYFAFTNEKIPDCGIHSNEYHATALKQVI